MEPERPKVDRAVLDFVKGYVFDPAASASRDDTSGLPKCVKGDILKLDKVVIRCMQVV